MLEKERVKLINTLKIQKEQMMKAMQTSKYRRMFDKITFFLSLAVIQYKCYALGRYSDEGVYAINLVLMIVLTVYRTLTYKVYGDHYYMLEF